MKIKLSDNVHPNTDGSPWGWIVIDGTKIRIATYSGHDEKKRCQEVVDIYNDAWEIKPTHHRGSGGYGELLEWLDRKIKESDKGNTHGDVIESLTYEKVKCKIQTEFLPLLNQESKKGFSELDMERMYLIGLLNRENMNMDEVSKEMAKAREKFNSAMKLIQSLTPNEKPIEKWDKSE